MFSSMFKLLFSIKCKWMGTGMVKIKIGPKKKKNAKKQLYVAL